MGEGISAVNINVGNPVVNNTQTSSATSENIQVFTTPIEKPMTKKELEAKHKEEAKRYEEQQKARAEVMVRRFEEEAHEAGKQGKEIRKYVNEQIEKNKEAIGKDFVGYARRFAGNENILRATGRTLLGIKTDDKKAAQYRATSITTDNRIKQTETKSDLSKLGLNKKLVDKIEKAGFTYTELEELFKDNAGADNMLNYSYNKEISERKQLAARLNSDQRAIDAGVKFSEGESNDIAKAIGGSVESKYNWTKVAGHTAIGAAAGAPLAFMKQTQTMVNHEVVPGLVNVTVDQTMTQTQSLGLLGPIVGAVVGGGTEMLKEALRNEKGYGTVDCDQKIETYAQFEVYIDSLKGDKNGAKVMKKFAKYFTKEDGTLDLYTMNNEIKAASGNKILNRSEIESMLNKYAVKSPVLGDTPCDGTKTVVVEKIVEVEKDCPEIEPPLVVEPPVVEPPAKVPCDEITYRVEPGDTVARIAAKFGISEKELLDANPGLKLHEFSDCNDKFKTRGLKIKERLVIPTTDDNCDELHKIAEKNLTDKEIDAKYLKHLEYLARKGECIDKAASAEVVRIIREKCN